MLVICAVLYLTLFPKPLPDNDIHFWEHADKLVHAIMMAAVYCALALDLRRPLTVRLKIALALVVVAFGGAIELVQAAMELGRSGSPADFAADAAGTIAAALLFKPESQQV